ncbi:hypothetical protein HJFPF1_00547 [Paramyrothecium foliicola]|nr:hypothetical protein HJFPF1_00547 [Paramyrothecium foliicola]
MLSRLTDTEATVIGRGSFGTIFEIPGTEWCLKKTQRDVTALWFEFSKGRTIGERVNIQARNIILRSEEFPNTVMPRVPRYLTSHGMGQAENPGQRFKENGQMVSIENGDQKPVPMICLERIMPLPRVIRATLIKLYFEPQKQAKALVDERNKACICRVYLGCTSVDEAPSKLKEARTTLQNFPLYLDQLVELGMDPFTIARDMAMGLAAAHWAANFDMTGVEWVIGSRPVPKTFELRPVSNADMKAAAERSSRLVRNVSAVYVPTAQERRTLRNCDIQLWMINFNETNPIEVSVREKYMVNIEQLVVQTRATEGHYYPRVLARNETEWKLWLEFARTYIRASRTIVDGMLDYVRRLGVALQGEELAMKRPALVMNAWHKVEAKQHGVSGKAFYENILNQKWEMP